MTRRRRRRPSTQFSHPCAARRDAAEHLKSCRTPKVRTSEPTRPAGARIAPVHTAIRATRGGARRRTSACKVHARARPGAHATAMPHGLPPGWAVHPRGQPGRGAWAASLEGAARAPSRAQRTGSAVGSWCFRPLAPARNHAGVCQRTRLRTHGPLARRAPGAQPAARSLRTAACGRGAGPGDLHQQFRVLLAQLCAALGLALRRTWRAHTHAAVGSLISKFHAHPAKMSATAAPERSQGFVFLCQRVCCC